MKSNLRSAWNTISSPKLRIANLMILMLVLAAVPITTTILSQRQNTKQYAASGDPSVSSVNAPSSVSPGGSVSVSASGNADTFRVYVHGSAYPDQSDPVQQSYDPKNVSPNKWYYVGNSPKTFTAPQNSFYIGVNAVIGDKTCAWEGKIFQGQPGQNYKDTGKGCTNQGAKLIQGGTSAAKPSSSPSTSPSKAPSGGSGTAKGTPSVKTVYFPASVSGSEKDFTVSADGNGDTFRVYIHGSTAPNYTDSTKDPVQQSYDPKNIKPNTWYYVGNSVATVKVPASSGTFYIGVNAVIGSQTCAWDGKLYEGTPGQSYKPLGKSCENVGIRSLPITSGSPSTAPTGGSSTPTSCNVANSSCTPCAGGNQICTGTEPSGKACQISRSCGDPNAGNQSCDCGTDKGFKQVSCGGGSSCIGVSGANPSCHYCAKPLAVAQPTGGSLTPGASKPKFNTYVFTTPKPKQTSAPFTPGASAVIIPSLLLLFFLFVS